ncbi:hypothetical protein CROQUDRAFT_663564 [Cronartium quercuum f. sp. fusiforme G11]|uniref:Uncharacterized protein n=1 Tax=Cronartium quercuum f. sp. fusiforme G11 TaxID=708437 RepID=A0A9P6N813_9BASI|nr:hypothetical protein CROQUDRAFT_663564 [Cronartium quercuum f. sp. fusiforme G11]
MEKFPDLVFHNINLFPTISHIQDSINGRLLTPLLWPISLPIVHLIQLAFALLIPKILLILVVQVLNAVTQTTNQYRTLSAHNLRSITKLFFNVNTTSAGLVLARSEMGGIVDVDQDFIRKHANKLSFYWTQKESDWWINEALVQEIVSLLGPSLANGFVESSDRAVDELHGSQRDFKSPDGVRNQRRWQRGTDGIPHAFCLEHGEQMADKCATWIQELLEP